MRKISTIAAALAFVLVLGCKNQNQYQQTASTPATSTSSSASQTLTPEQLGELGAKIKKNPKEADKILSDKGLTQQQFEQQVRKVAENPDASKRYAQAYKKGRA